jgi:hypothetical protein
MVQRFRLAPLVPSPASTRKRRGPAKSWDDFCHNINILKEARMAISAPDCIQACAERKLELEQRQHGHHRGAPRDRRHRRAVLLRVGFRNNPGQQWIILDPQQFAGHSMRAGFLTSAAGRDTSIFKVMAVSRHRSVETFAAIPVTPSCSGITPGPGCCRSRIAVPAGRFSECGAAPGMSG